MTKTVLESWQDQRNVRWKRTGFFRQRRWARELGKIYRGLTNFNFLLRKQAEIPLKNSGEFLIF